MFLERLHQLLPKSDLVVFSFREEPWEPPFLEAIREATMDRGGTFIEEADVSSTRQRELWAKTPFDLLMAVNWRYPVHKRVYLLPRMGSFVFHDSLLPRYRGFSPTVWAMIKGERSTGASLIEMTDPVDTGAIIAQVPVAIAEDDTIADVMNRVTSAYLELLEGNLDALLAGSAPRTAQDETQATYVPRRLPEDNEIDWRDSAKRIHDLVRAVTKPYPGAFTYLGGRRITVWRARIEPLGPWRSGPPGRILEVQAGRGAVVGTGSGCLLVTSVQFPGRDVEPAWTALASSASTLGS